MNILSDESLMSHDELVHAVQNVQEMVVSGKSKKTRLQRGRYPVTTHIHPHPHPRVLLERTSHPHRHTYTSLTLHYHLYLHIPVIVTTAMGSIFLSPIHVFISITSFKLDRRRYIHTQVLWDRSSHPRCFLTGQVSRSRSSYLVYTPRAALSLDHPGTSGTEWGSSCTFYHPVGGWLPETDYIGTFRFFFQFFRSSL